MLRKQDIEPWQTSAEWKALCLSFWVSKGRDRREGKHPGNYKGIDLRRDASPAFGNPARSRLPTSVGFAALVHTRCAFIVSGTCFKKPAGAFKPAAIGNLTIKRQPCQALLKTTNRKWHKSAMDHRQKTRNYCYTNEQRPPLSLFCNNFIIPNVHSYWFWRASQYAIWTTWDLHTQPPFLRHRPLCGRVRSHRGGKGSREKRRENLLPRIRTYCEDWQ